MTKYQILLALYSLLYEEFENNSDRSEEYIQYISSVDPYLWTDGKTADPAYYTEFMEIMEDISSSDNFSASEAYDCALKYLSELEKRSDSDISEVVETVRSCPEERWTAIADKLTAGLTKKYKCPCCGYYTMDEPNGSYGICEVCFWEDDRSQNNDPELAGGANRVCLREARENFLRYGACDEKAIPFTRMPTAEEVSGIVHEPDDSDI